MRKLAFLLALTFTLSRALAQEFPRSAQLCYELGETWMAQREWQKALSAFDASLQRDPSFADSYYARGLVLEHFNRWQDALTNYNIYLEFRPQHTEALFNRAQLRFRLELYELAKADFQQLLIAPQGETSTVFFRQNPFSGEVNQVFTTQGSNKSYLFNYLGLIEIELNNYANAIACFDSALFYTPSDPDLYVNKGIASEGLDSTNQAIRNYERALSLNGHHALAKHNLSILQSKHGTDSASNRLLDESIEADPKLPFGYAERGYARLERGDIKGALDDFNQAIRIDSTQADYFLNRGLAYEKLHRPLVALTDYNKALALNNTFTKAWLNRGNLNARLSRLPEAIEDYTVAIFYDPAYGMAYYNRALAHYRLGNKQQACGDLNSAEGFDITIPAQVKSKLCPGR